MEISLKQLLHGHQFDSNRPYALKTPGTFGRGLRTAIHGIPYTDTMKANDKEVFRKALENASDEGEKEDIYCEALDQIWWRGLEAKPIWKRIPEFIHAWIYVRLHPRGPSSIRLSGDLTISFRN